MWKRSLLLWPILCLCACATTRPIAAPCLKPPPPDPLLMQAPAYEQSLRAILQQGQTSDPTSSATTDAPTPR